jgi:D-lactate dehydrogenase, membrane binding
MYIPSIPDQAVVAGIVVVVGTSSTLVQRLWHVKLWIEALPYEGAPLWIDKLVYNMNNFFPALLPKEIMEMGHSRDHRVVITMGEFGDGNLDRI